MNNYEYVFDYKNNDLLRNSFFSLAYKTFNLEFNTWYEKGFWDDSYICHSLVHKDEIISNVSTTKMHLVIDNKEINAIQIGTVMTHPDYRMKGLSRILMDKVLLKYCNDYELIYLFPNESVMDFYPKFGFELTHDYLYSLDIDLKNTDKNVGKLDINSNSDLILINELISKRIFNSSKFYCRNLKSIFMWYCHSIFKDKIYILEPENILIIYDQDDDKNINIYDIVSNEPHNLKEVAKRITNKLNVKITFYFTPEFPDIKQTDYSIIKNELIFAKPVRNFSDKVFAHPVMSHT